MINFENVPKVALQFMNDDHEEATKITNALMTLVGAADNGEPNPEGISYTLEELLTHCREHFGREQVQMEQFAFPPYPVHKAEHDRVLEEMEAELNAWRETEDLERLKVYVFNTLPEWFIGHIETMDTVTAMFIERSGGPA